MPVTIITQPDEINFTRNPIPLVLDSGSAVAGQRLELTFTVDVISMLLILYTDVLGYVTIDLHKYIDDIMYKAYDNLAEVTFGAPQVYADEMTKPCTFSAILTDDSESEPATGTFVVVKGGVANQHFPVYKFWTNFLAAANNAIPFLTWNNISKKKLTSPSAPEFLAYYLKANNAYITAYYQAYNNVSGLIGGGVIPAASWNTGYGKKIFYIACGLGNVDFSGVFPESTCDYYYAWIESDDDGQISEKRKYFVDHTKHVHTHHFVFANSIGGLDTLTTHGAIDATPEISRSIIKKYNDYTYYVQSGNLQASNINTKSAFKAVHTSQSWYEHLLMQDMVASPLVFKFENGQYKPIIITSSKVPLGNPDNYIHTCEFDYILAYDNTQYTPDQLFPV